MTLLTPSISGLTAGRRLVLVLSLFLATGGPSRLLGSDVYTFSTIPSDGNISGAPGATIGWGYSITNESTSDWLLATNLNADSFAFGTPTLLFDFPEVAPGATASEIFDPIGMTGLYEDTLNASAPDGSVDSGNFVLSAEWFDGDPFNGGNFIADAVDTDDPYSATVSSNSGSVPEPSSFVLFATGIAAIMCWLKVRNGQLARAAASHRSRMFHARSIALPLVFALIGSSVGRAQQGPPPSENGKDSGITRQQADEILNELKAIRQLLEKQNRQGPGPLPSMPQIPQTGKLRLDGGYTLGSNDAPVTIVEFTDYQCQYCRQFESMTFAELRKKYIDTGKVRFVVRDFPLVEVHPNAMQAAEAAHCAGDQEKFWPMHDALFSDASKLGKSGLMQSAESLKLDMGVFRSCLESGKHKLEIQNDLQVASSLQINGTPSFLVGKTTGEELSGAIIIGAQSFSVFEAKLEEAEAAR